MQTIRLVRNFSMGIFALVLGVLILAIVTLHTGALNDILRAEITRQLRDRYNTLAEIGSLKLGVVPLTLELKKVEVRRENTPAAEPSLFRAQRLLVGVQFLPLLHGKLELSQLVVDEPVARLRIDANGQDNFALASKQRPGSSGSGSVAVFDLEIQNCVIHSGELYFNDAQIPLDAEVHDLKFVAGYSRLSGEYKGSLSYDRGRLVEPGFAPIAHAVQMEFVASPSVLSIHSLRLTSGSSGINLIARISNYAHPVVEATYRANLSTKELTVILEQPALPAGRVILDGTVNYRNSPQESFLAGLNLQGRLRSDGLSLSGADSGTQRGLHLSAITGAYELKDGSFHLRELAASVLGGSVRASADIEHIDAAAPAVQLAAAVKGVSLAVASGTLAPPDVHRIPFAGSADIQARAGWIGPFSSWSENLVANARLSLSSPVQEVSAQTIPVSGLILVDYDAQRNRISFGQSYLQTRATRVSIAGTLEARSGGNSAVMVNASTGDLREVGSLLAIVETAVQPGAIIATIPGLGGSATLTATASGTAKAPRIEGELTAQKLRVGGSHWRSFRAGLTASPSGVSIRDASLLGDSRETIALNGEAGLQDWSLTPESQISVRGTAAGIALNEVTELAHLNYPVTGNVSASISLSGTRGAPEGTAAVTLANGSAWDQPFSQLVLKSDFHQGAIHSTTNLQTTAGAVSADGTYNFATQAYSLQIHGAGLQLNKIAALQSREVQGAADLSAVGSGTLASPSLQANLTVPQLQSEGQTLSNVTAQIAVAHQHANISLHSIVDQGSVQATADVNLTGNRYTTATLDVSALPVAVVAANFMPAQSAKIGGQTQIHATLQGPLVDPAQMQLRLQIPTLKVTYGVAQLALSRPLEANYQNGVLTVMNSQIQGTGTNLTFGGTIRINNVAAYSINADGTVDLGVLHKFASSIDSRGELSVHLSSQGDANHPSMQGQIQIKNAVFSSETLPVSVEGLNGEIALSGNRAAINSLSGVVGGGKVSATGAIDFGRAPHFALVLNAQSVRIRYPQGLRSVLSAQINAEGSPAGSALTGRVTLDSLSFTQEFDLANFVGALSENSSGGTPSELEKKMKLNVALVSSQDLSLANSQISLGGSANLNLVGTLAEPVILGRLGLASGDVFFLGKRFEVQSGTIEFANPARTDPVLNLYIKTTVEQYSVTLKLSGPIDHLRTSYTSDPTLSQADIIHLLAFGNTNAEAASAAPTSATESAESVVASGVTSQLTGKLESLTGISQFTIDPISENTQGDPGAVIGIQERVTGRLLFTYSTNVTDTQAQSASLKYDLTKQVSVTIFRDQNGGYGIDVRVHKVF